MSKVHTSPESRSGRVSGTKKTTNIDVFGVIQPQASIEYVADIHQHCACCEVVGAEHLHARHVLFAGKEVPVSRPIYGLRPRLNLFAGAPCQLSGGRNQQGDDILPGVREAVSFIRSRLIRWHNHVYQVPGDSNGYFSSAAVDYNRAALVYSLMLLSSIDSRYITDCLAKAGLDPYAAFSRARAQWSSRTISSDRSGSLPDLPRLLGQLTCRYIPAKQRADHYPVYRWTRLWRVFLTAVQSLKKKQITNIIFNNIPRIFDLQIVSLHRLFGTIMLSVKRPLYSVSRQNAMPGHGFTHCHAAASPQMLSQPDEHNRSASLRPGQWQERLCKSH